MTTQNRQYRISDVDADTKQRLQVEEGFGENAVAVEVLPAGASEWELVGYSDNRAEAEQYIKQTTDPDAHKAFFEKKRTQSFGDNMEAAAEAMRNATPQQVRQQQRRSEAFEKLLTNVMTGPRVEPGGGPDFARVTWEEFETMHKEYQDAAKQNKAKDFEFQPLSAYIHKIVQRHDDGSVKRVIRQPFKNEAGVLTLRDGTTKIVILKDQGPGDIGEKYFQVPNNIEEKP